MEDGESRAVQKNRLGCVIYCSNEQRTEDDMDFLINVFTSDIERVAKPSNLLLLLRMHGRKERVEYNSELQNSRAT